MNVYEITYRTLGSLHLRKEHVPARNRYHAAQRLTKMDNRTSIEEIHRVGATEDFPQLLDLWKIKDPDYQILCQFHDQNLQNMLPENSNSPNIVQLSSTLHRR